MSDPTQVTLRPLGSVVLVLPKAARLETESGIALADVAYEPETCGLVIAIGSGFYCAGCEQQRDPSVKIGDWVAFSRGAGGEVRLGEVDYVLLLEEECLAVLETEPAVCEVA